MNCRRFWLLPVMMIAGCSGFTPYASSPPSLELGTPSPGTRVAICYNGFKSEPDEVLKLAQAECPPNTVPESMGTDYRMDDCPVMTPARATFLCKTAK